MRCDYWLGAKVDSEGRPINEHTAEIHQKIETTRQDGTFVAEGPHDTLTQVLGTEEHGGRVRTGGHGATKSSVFGRDTSCGTKKDREIAILNQSVSTLSQHVQFLNGMVQSLWELQSSQGHPSFPTCSVPVFPTPPIFTPPFAPTIGATPPIFTSPSAPTTATTSPIFTTPSAPTSPPISTPASVPTSTPTPPIFTTLAAPTPSIFTPPSSTPSTFMPNITALPDLPNTIALSTSGSAAPIPPFSDLDEGECPCDLVAELGGDVVAHGTAYIHTDVLCGGAIASG